MLSDIIRGFLTRSGWSDREAQLAPGMLTFVIQTGARLTDVRSWPVILSEPVVERFLQINEFEGVKWFSKESLELFAACLAEIAPCEGWELPETQLALRSAEAAGYRWETFKELLAETDREEP
jgi:hypothetical protein